MSKRDKGALIEEYAQRGFLSSAVRNYICLLGWSPKDDREKMDIGEIIERFDFPGINKGNARFDEQKLAALNSEYLRELEIGSFTFLVRPILAEAGAISEDEDEDYLQSVLKLAQPKARSLEDLPEYVAYFFKEDYAVDEKTASKIAKKADPKTLIAEILPVLEGIEAFDADSLKSALEAHAEQKGQKVFAYFPALRFAVSGQGGGPDLLPMLEVMGRERVLGRLREFNQ
jgi:glutamyl-tRNA synthetase